MPEQPQNAIALSQFSLAELLKGVSLVIDEKLQAFKKQEIEEKLLSPAEACRLFQPAISKPTLQSWTDQGLLKDYRLGSRVFYKYSEIIEAAKTLKRYKKKLV